MLTILYPPEADGKVKEARSGGQGPPGLDFPAVVEYI